MLHRQGLLGLLLTMCLCHFMEDHTVQAGNCWLQQSKNGRCQVLYRTELSKEECCKTGRLGTSWTEEDVPNSTLFKWMIFNGGAPHCIPCKETCENVDCGPGKKCKMNKKNKPRCVCAPDCSNITWKGPVCGLDGKTYKDECALLKAKCKGVPELDVQYQGKCKSMSQMLLSNVNPSIAARLISVNMLMLVVMAFDEAHAHGSVLYVYCRDMQRRPMSRNLHVCGGPNQ
ncbi:hypothetical protein GDO81_002788 [Engystomops pustulosus]|uniref:Follistatin n=1 Tax=Engystomops pustulosus TaxID=76066 RepID=A0AAV7DMX4_ENGPU|nr:hypothetical protein GDO81_002788 [Engystomops pustulosus]